MKKFGLTPRDNKTNDKTKQGASPLNDALFLHFKKWNPEVLNEREKGFPNMLPIIYNEDVTGDR